MPHRKYNEADNKKRKAFMSHSKEEYTDSYKYPKRKVVKAWASKIRNFGPGESGRHYLKSFPAGGHHDLLEHRDREVR